MITHYELLYIISGNYTEEELQPIKQEVNDMLAVAGAKILLEDTLGKRKLSYPIKGLHQGYYLLAEFELEGEKLKALNQNLRLSSSVVRHIIVKRDAKMPSYKEMNEKQAERDQRKKLETERQQREAAEKVAPDVEREKSKAKLEDLDQKLDEILEGDIL